MRLFIISVMVAAVLFPASIALATEHKSDDMVVVSLPIGDDLYTAGANVLISKPVGG